MTAAAPGALPTSLAGAEWLIRPETQAIFRAIAAAGYSARIVGGAVRNSLIRRPVTDIDFATTARPEDAMALAVAAGLKAVPTGIDHGTITVIADHVPYEVTTLREDVETFGRRARVAFTGDWAADARRRDFTMNALYCEADGTVFDPLGGLPDLAARRVRFIGNAVDRIREDYLRILRFFRFHAEYGQGDMDSESLAACVAERAGLARLSGERIRTELMKLLAADGAMASAGVMAREGIAAIVLGTAPQIEPLARLLASPVVSHARPDPVLRLLAWLPADADADSLKARLRLSSADADRLEGVNCVARTLRPAMSENEMKAAIYRAGRSMFLDAVEIAAARAPADGWPALAHLARAWHPPVLPMRGADLLALGVPPGPEVGRMLAELERRWIAADFPVDRAEVGLMLSRIMADRDP